MMVGHLTIFGLAEVVFTTAVLAYLRKTSPDLFQSVRMKTNRALYGLIAALIVCTPLGLLAAGTAWGEWDPEELAEQDFLGSALGYTPAGMEQGFSFEALFPDYAIAGLPEAFGYILSALIGTALGLYAWAQVDESSDNKSLVNPAKKFTYVEPQGLDDTYVVFIIGETTRWDHMGILGYNRNTTPKLAQEKNLVAFRGYACDTATKLSLRCMFVRQGGADDNPQRTLKEQNVFAVLHQLGFSGNLYAMQSEMWFYSNTMANNIAYREQIGAEPSNSGKSVDDMLLVDEMQRGLSKNPGGKHLIILHTKGSHFNYTQRYPRSFAQWKPECVGVDNKCSKAELINSYDNSVTYVDHFIVSVLDQLRDKKAIVFYAADHGESINEREHLHGLALGGGFLEAVQHLRRQGRVEIIGHDQFSRQDTDPFSGQAVGTGRNQFGFNFAVGTQKNRFPRCRAFDQLR